MMGSSSTLPLQPVTGSTDCCTALEIEGTCRARSRGSSSAVADPPPPLQTMSNDHNTNENDVLARGHQVHACMRSSVQALNPRVASARGLGRCSERCRVWYADQWEWSLGLAIRLARAE